MAINPVSPHQPIASSGATEPQKKPESAGDRPYSRSAVSSDDPRQTVQVHPRYIGGANFYEAPRTPAKTSSSSPHIPGHPGADNPRAKLDPNGNPTHLFGFQNGKPVVLQKVQHEASGSDQPAATVADESSKPKRAASPSPHIVGGHGAAGQQEVNLDPKGNPTHLIFSGPHGAGVANKV